MIQIVLVILLQLTVSTATAVASQKPVILNQDEYSGQRIGEHMEYVFDHSKLLGLTDIRSDAFIDMFAPIKAKAPNFGIRDANLWLKIPIENPQDKAQDIILELRYSFLDHVILFVPGPSGYQATHHGDRVKPHKDQLDHRKPSFQLKIPPGDSIFYAKIETKGPINVPLHLWSPKPFFSHQRLDSILVGLTFGFLLVMMLYNAFLAISFRSRAYSLYTALVGFIIVTQLGIMGLAQDLSDGAFGIWLSNMGFAVCSVIGGMILNQFSRHFLNVSSKNRLINVSTKFLNGLGPIILLVILFSDYSIGARLGPIYISCISLVLITAGIHFAMAGYRPAIYYTLGWICFLFGLVILSLQFSGLIQQSLFTTWSVPFGACIQAVLMSLALADRVNNIRDQAEAKINNLNTSLQHHIEKVEEIVEERTQTIRMILDHVKTGFLLVNPDLTIASGFSKSCEGLLPEIAEGRTIATCFQIEGREREGLELAFEQIFTDMLPENVSLSVLHRRVKTGQRYLDLEGSIIRDQTGHIQSILLTILDATELQLSEKEIQLNHMLLKMLRYHRAFKEFVIEAQNSLKRAKSALQSGHKDEAKGIIHTLKGNFSIYTMDDFVRLIHEIEEDHGLHPAALEEVETRFKNFIAEHKSLLNIDWESGGTMMFDVSEDDLEDALTLAEKLTDSPERAALLSILQKMRSVAVADYLGPVHEEVQRLADKLGKSIDFRVTGADTLVPNPKFVDLIEQVIHLIRNAVDHGIESDRRNLKKPTAGSIELRFQKTSDEFLITVEDDGGGIDVGDIGQKALARQIINRDQLAQMSDQQCLQLIMHDAFTSKDDVDLISGRGYGLAAIKQTVTALDGSIAIDSTIGEGTRFTLSLPLLEAQQAA